VEDNIMRLLIQFNIWIYLETVTKRTNKFLRDPLYHFTFDWNTTICVFFDTIIYQAPRES